MNALNARNFCATKKGRTRLGRMRPLNQSTEKLPAHLHAGPTADAALAAAVPERVFLHGESDTAAQSPALAVTGKVVAQNSDGRKTECHVALPETDAPSQAKALAGNEVGIFESNSDGDTTAEL